MSGDVFISYAGEDGQVADIVCRTLEENGIACWYAPRDIPLGTNYEEAIIEAIFASRILILILSAHSNSSPHVQREIQNACAEESATEVIPLRIDNVPLSKALRYYLASVQWLDASMPPLEAHLQRLVSHVRRRLVRGSQVSEKNLQHTGGRSEREDEAKRERAIILPNAKEPPPNRFGVDKQPLNWSKWLIVGFAGLSTAVILGIFVTTYLRNQNSTQGNTNSMAPPSPSPGPAANNANASGNTNVAASPQRGGAGNKDLPPRVRSDLPAVITENPLASLFQGMWFNEAKRNRVMAKLEIEQVSGQLRVHAWGECSPGPCDWGIKEGTLTGGKISAIWNLNVTRRLTIALTEENRLLVILANLKADGSPGVEYKEFFVKRP